ncbi:MAG: DnaB-like helicase N-terminal domain-containing protein, partial [Bacillota bacterium]|nr:DnaB-like helicase N-terminal domain-containing protein [Bacillota bacterium]
MDMPLKIMPQNLEAEQCVLGAMIMDKSAIAEAAESLKSDDFYRDSHKIVYEVIIQMFQKDIPIDIVTLTENLTSKQKLETIGGITYLTEICNSVFSTANLRSYIKIVEDKSLLRKLIKASSEIIEESYNKQDNVPEVLDGAEKRIFNIAENRVTSDFEPMNVVLERGFLEIERIYNNKGQITGVPSGFPELDAKTSGFQKGDMVLIAARP